MWAIESLERIGDQTDLALFRRALDDEDWRVRFQAAVALGTWSPDESLAALLAFRSTEPWWRRWLVGKAVRSARRRVRGSRASRS
jgi:HEAT repeat protein